MPSFRRLKKERPNAKVKENTDSEETVLAECSNLQKRRSVLVQRSPQGHATLTPASNKLQHEQDEDRGSIKSTSTSRTPTPTPTPTIMPSPSIPLTPPPRTFLDNEGGTPVSASLNGSIAQRRRQGEYHHRPPVWNILSMQGDKLSLPSDCDSDSDSGADSEVGVVPLNRTSNNAPITTGIHEEACQFCLGRLPESIVGSSSPVGEGEGVGVRIYGDSRVAVDRAFSGNSKAVVSPRNGEKVAIKERQSDGNEPRTHWLKRFRSLTVRRHGDREEKTVVGLRGRLRSTLRRREQSQPCSSTGSLEYIDARKSVSDCLTPVQSDAESPKSG